MTYEAAYQRLEEVVTYMQKDLLKYADRDDASDRAVKARNDSINTIIEFAKQAGHEIGLLREALLNEQLRYNNLHADSAKLVMFCTLHSINPNMIFHYSADELKRMISDGMRIAPPILDLNKIMVVGDEPEGYHLEYAQVEREYPEDEKLREIENKYLTLKQLVKP